MADQSWFSTTIDYVYKTVSGEDCESTRTSDYHRAFSNGVMVKDLPTNNYEPLESTCMGRRATPQQVQGPFNLTYLRTST